MIATDLAARGLDIQGIKTVLNFEMPRNMVEYIHRVGRTARAGEEGKSISLVGDDDRALLKRIVRKARDKVKQRIIPPEEVERTKEQIAAMEEDIRSITREEKTDRVMRMADMEAKKAGNLVEHNEDIMARPARTWFITEKEKKANQSEDFFPFISHLFFSKSFLHFTEKLKQEYNGKPEAEMEDENGGKKSEKKRKREVPKVIQIF